MDGLSLPAGSPLPLETDAHAGSPEPPVLDRNRFGQVVLVLQGGGALGAYHGGVFQAPAEAGAAPGQVTGASIGAINAPLATSGSMQGGERTSQEPGADAAQGHGRRAPQPDGVSRWPRRGQHGWRPRWPRRWTGCGDGSKEVRMPGGVVVQRLLGAALGPGDPGCRYMGRLSIRTGG